MSSTQPPKFTKRRPSYTRKSAMRFLYIFNELLTQISSGRPQGMFLGCHEYNNIQPSSLQNQFSDSLKWLRDHNLSETEDRRMLYEQLRACITTRIEVNGLRVLIISGPQPVQALRPNNMADLKQPSSWKDEVQDFLTKDNDEPVKQWRGILVSGDNILWLRNICTSLGATQFLEGDTLTVAKGK